MANKICLDARDRLQRELAEAQKQIAEMRDAIERATKGDMQALAETLNKWRGK